MEGLLRSVSIGKASTLFRGGRVVDTAFVKQPVSGSVELGRLGPAGDEHVYRFHGGPDMAVLVYSYDHHGFWRDTVGLDLPEAAAFGENFTVEGLTETQVWLGDVFTVGSARVQVTQPRQPCSKIAARYGRDDLPQLVHQTGYSGYLLRVLDEGAVAAGDRMILAERADHGVTVAEALRILGAERHHRDEMSRLLAIGSLGSRVRETLQARLAELA
jgi:MOSC domain-containing protein YiiM